MLMRGHVFQQSHSGVDDVLQGLGVLGLGFRGFGFRA